MFRPVHAPAPSLQQRAHRNPNQVVRMSRSGTCRRCKGAHVLLDEQATQHSTSSSAARRGPRVKRQPAPAARLEAAEDPLGPLGGDTAPQEEPAPPPELPSKASQPPESPKASPASPPPSRGRARIPAAFRDDDDDDEDISRTRYPGASPQQQGPDRAGARYGKQSMSVEQASKPSFIITVGDPHKVGDLTGSHTVYQVRTRVG